jgi:glycosyltransferase involved in cell wall biosynthesis
MWLSRKLHIPFVVTTHGVDVFSTGRESGLSRWWCKKSSLSVYSRANRNICVSGLSRKNLLKGMRNQAEVDVVYNGVNTDLFYPSNNTDGNSAVTVLTVGRLDAIKGQDKVLRAMAKLTTKFPSLRCEIIGEGDNRPRLMEIARELGIEEKVDMLGIKSRREVAEAMRRCTVFALPSRQEALGCVFLEAMATARPVIASQGEGISEIIRHGENGLLVESNNPQQLTESLSMLLEDASLRNRLGDEGRKTIVEGLTLAHQAERLNRIYRECLK